MGRKRLITIRVTDEEYKMIKDSAKEKRITMSKMIMQLIYRFLDKVY